MNNPVPKRPKPSVAMTREEIMDFLKAGKPAVVCVPDSSGRLVARVVPYRLRSNDPATAMELSLAGAAADLPGGDGACVIVDTYPSYDRIQGVLLRGALRVGDTGQARLEAVHASGFDFGKLKQR